MDPFYLIKPALAAIILACLLSGCTPTVMTHRLEPVSGNLATIDGRTVTRAEQNGIGVVASFEREDMEFIALDVEIKNHTDHPIDVDPADFHFVALNAQQQPLATAGAGPDQLPTSAANPAYESGRMDLKRRQEEKRLNRAKILNTVLMVAVVASDISSSNRPRSYGEYVTNRTAHGLAYQGLAAKRVINHTTFANRMERYNYEEYRWRNLALLANTLAPGESVRGFVYLPNVTSASYINLTYTLPEQASVPILFRQEQIIEKRNRKSRR
ncbi:hypothetical protein [Spirosoma rigui]|uniref:hypothetical protein n=1 Tax=Spirosoma rigui TaxID=564064 RepID=UPI0009B1506D|nr:hypothetical protein [Spirosoma rigui]